MTYLWKSISFLTLCKCKTKYVQLVRKKVILGGLVVQYRKGRSKIAINALDEAINKTTYIYFLFNLAGT